MNLTKYFMSASMEEQISKSILVFCDKSKEPKTRVKSLQNIIKFHQENNEELTKLFNFNHIEIFDLLYFSLISFRKGSFYLSLSSDDEIGNIFKVLKKLILILSNVKCRALFLNYRDKIILLLYYCLNTIVQLRIRMKAFKILLKILDVLLFFDENDQGLIEVFNHCIEFSLFEKNNDQKFTQNAYSLQDLIKEHKIHKEIANEVYGEWIKQIQENNRNFVEDKLLNWFFKFWLQSPEKIKKWFDLFLKSWVFPIFEITENQNLCFKLLSPLKMKILERTLSALYKVLQENDLEENYITSEHFNKVIKVFGCCSKDQKVWRELYELYAELFQESTIIKIKNLNEEKFLLSLFSEIKEGVFYEIDSFSKVRNEIEQGNLDEKFYIFNSIMDKIINFLLESPKYEKSYNLIDEAISTICEIVKYLENIDLLKKIQIVVNPMIKSLFLMILKWEDYLKNSWNKLKEIMKILCKHPEIFANIEKLLINKTEDFLERIYNEENLNLFKNFRISDFTEIKPEYLPQLLLSHHKENCDCSFYIRSQNFNFQTSSFRILTEEKMWEKEKLNLYKKFKKWLHFMLFFFEEEFFADISMYVIIVQIVRKIINLFMNPELANEKGKTIRFSPPLQTFMEIFGIFFHLALDFPKFDNFENFFDNYMISAQKLNKKEGILIVCKLFLSLFYETRSEFPLSKEIMSSFIKFSHKILSNYTQNNSWKLINMILINFSAKFLSLNPIGIKILIPLYVKVANSIILFEQFPKKEFFELTSVLGDSSFKVSINEIRFQAIDVLKLSYELSTKFASLSDVYEENRRLGDNLRVIFEVSVEILNKIAYENENFKNFENSLKKNIFTFILLILKNFNNEFFSIIWDLLQKISILKDGNFYSYLTIKLFKNLLVYKDKLINMDKAYFKRLIESLILKLGHYKNLSLEEIRILLDTIQHWLLNYNFEKIDTNVLQLLSETLRILSKSQEIYNNFEIFNAFFLKNIFNFPAKNQGNENVHSIFNEGNYELVEKEYLRSQIIEGNDENKQSKHLTSTENMALTFSYDQKKITRLNFRRTSSLKTEEDEISQTNSPSPRLKFMLNIKKQTNFMNGPKYVQFSLFHKEKQKIDKFNHNLSYQVPDRVLLERMMISLNNSIILSFLKSDKEEKMYILTRNIAGKFLWSFNFLKFGSSFTQKIADKSDERVKSDKIARFRDRKRSENLVFSAKLIDDNNFTKFIMNLLRNFSEIEEFDQQHKSFYDEGILKKLRECLKITKKNEKKFDFQKFSTKRKKNSFLDFRTKTNNFLNARLFLQQLGFDSDQTPLNLLDSHNEQFQNFLNILDLTPERECLKIGVFYVSSAHKTQIEILKNRKTSQNYERFLKSLGDKISLEKHLGYMAGLKANVDGKSTIYYADSSLEIVFHVSTMMPTNEDDEQQITKKRHIGNDSVNIVWCEDHRDYRYTTIISHFTSIYIIIYPLKDNLFRIHISKKAHIPCFFPWIDNVILDFDELGDLIKMAAINGSRIAREINATATTYSIPKDFLIKSNEKSISISLEKYNCYKERKKLILEIMEKFSAKNKKRHLFPYSFLSNYLS